MSRGLDDDALTWREALIVIILLALTIVFLGRALQHYGLLNS